MQRFEIQFSEIGFGIFDVESRRFVIEGIAEWCVACELHEMMVGELE
ncbi:hypothetical protein ACQZV8_03115 [Magnetococcales bacterium HHB-1]